LSILFYFYIVVMRITYIRRGLTNVLLFLEIFVISKTNELTCTSI